MELKKNSLKSDKIANLYRAALYLGKGERKTGLSFLAKAGFQKFAKPKNRQEELLLAEKALDQYNIFRLSV